MSMKRVTIGRKIAFACAALVALTIISNLTALVSIVRMQAKLETIATTSLPKFMLLARVAEMTKDQRISMLTRISSEGAADGAKLDVTIADLDNSRNQSLAEYEKLPFSERERDLLGKFRAGNDNVMSTWQKILPLVRISQKRRALALWQKEIVPAATERQKHFAELLRFINSQAEQNAAASEDAGRTGRTLGWWITLISVLSGAGVAYVIVRGVNRTLCRTVDELTEGARQIAGAAGQMSSSSQGLAQGASEQATSLGETSASAEEITSMTRKNAENSQDAAAVMAVVNDCVKEANRTLEQMVVSMQEINISSGKISKIIKVIDEIAFQTNILALNAAVEAARAGEAGMGFAVVADEVRNLAHRSAQAAKDTAVLIEESIANSTDGRAKLKQVGDVIRAITESAVQVKTLVDEVNLGSQEQARGIEQISKAVTKMEQVTQTNAANAEESASASEEVLAQTEALNHLIDDLRKLVGSEARAVSFVRTKPGRTLTHRKVEVPVASSKSPDHFSLDDSFSDL
jgi:methyl-accepting chemotaxis protein